MAELNIHPATDPTNHANPADPNPLFVGGGPFLHQELTTAYPHPDFLAGISDLTLLGLEVPGYLSYVNWVVKYDNSAAVDLFRYYLCASLAQHLSYRVAYWSETAPTPVGEESATRRYQDAYSAFEKAFTTALSSLMQRVKNAGGSDFSDERRRQQRDDLRLLEQNLTHETFSLWPLLFNRSLEANAELLNTLTSQNLALHHVLANHEDPLGFIQGSKVALRRQWIDLSDAADVLDGRCWRYAIYQELGRRWWSTWKRLETWEGFVEEGMAAFQADDGGVGARAFDEWWDNSEPLGVGVTKVGYEIMDELGCVGWKRELGARLLIPVGDWARERAERMERRMRERAERMERRMRDRAWRRATLPWLRETAPGKENARPVFTGQVTATQVGDATPSSAEWDPEAFA